MGAAIRQTRLLGVALEAEIYCTDLHGLNTGSLKSGFSALKIPAPDVRAPPACCRQAAYCLWALGTPARCN